MSETHPWDLYRDTRDRFITLVRSLDEQQLAMSVPLTPDWTVLDVLAHLCGLNGHVVAGLREGLGTAERTAEQVSTRAGMTREQICEEWLGHTDYMADFIKETPLYGLRLNADLVVHLHDVMHGLGLPVDRDDETTVRSGGTYAGRMVDEYVQSANVKLLIDLGAGGRFEPSEAPADATELTLRATAFDYLRTVTARRSTNEVLTLDWSEDPTPLLPTISPYGALRTEDAGF